MTNSNNLVNIDFNKLIDENNDTVIKIFDYIKLHNWKELKKIIETTNIDLNIKDNSNTYLLEYVIIFNQVEIIDLLLKKEIRIDITDDYSRSILYSVIKFSYLDILKKLLEKDKLLIGKSILEIKDNDDNIPLFYAIKFFNIDSVNIILPYTNNFYIKNKEGDNALHISIKSENFEMFKLINSYFPDLKSRNIKGESYLHLIIKYKCYDMLDYIFYKIIEQNIFKELLNYVEYKYNFTILHYIAINLDYRSLEIISNHDLLSLLNGNIQDISGNIFYHYFINNLINLKKLTFEITNNIININTLFKKINFNINLYNIDGNTPSHIFFSNINFFSNNNLNILINWITEKSSMNIQNFNGESIFYLIIKNNYWKQINNILIKKKLDIFIIADDYKTIFDYIEKNDYNKFLKMIVNSYLYQLSNKKSSFEWIDYWDNRCKKIVKYNELNETELNLLKNLNIKKSNENICFDIIKTKIDKSIEQFIENKNFFELSSFPVSNKFAKLISEYPTVIVSTFSGSTIDVLSGLIYLINKFEKIKKNYLITSIEFIKNNDNIIDCKNSKINPLNKSINNSNYICEIIGFELLWINKNIFFPSDNDINIDYILKFIIKNKNDGYRWFVIPIGIEIRNYSHANYLLFDIEKMEVERFEPHGAYPPNNLNYDPDLLDSTLIDYLNNLGFKFNYFKPIDYLPKIGFQIKEINELNSDYIGDPNGFCALWCIWWTDIRLLNPDLERKKLVKLLNKELINGKYSYKKLIRDYSYYIINIRDNILLKANTNINEWINDIITEKNIELLNLTIKDTIKNL